MGYEELLKCLKGAGHNTRCDTIKSLLESLGFKVRKGNNGKHHVFTHKGLAPYGFYSASFDCTHGSKNSLVKIAYIKNIIRIVSKYETELRTYLGEIL